jgi:hypothetical protein
MILFDESSDTYHDNPAIGSGNIRDFLKSPKLFRGNMDGLWKRTSSKALELGSLAHLYFLEGEKFQSQVEMVPDGLDRRTKEGKAWAEAKAGKTLIKQEDWQTIEQMAASCPPSVYNLLANGKSEVTVRARMEGLDCQCRFDNWNGYTNTIIDLKTTKDIDTIGQSVWNYGYHIQQEWYQRLALCETGKQHTFTFIFVETEPPYRWRIVTLADDLTRIAEAKVSKALTGIKERMASGDWTDSLIQQTITAPAWAKE